MTRDDHDYYTIIHNTKPWYAESAKNCNSVIKLECLLFYVNKLNFLLLFCAFRRLSVNNY